LREGESYLEKDDDDEDLMAFQHIGFRFTMSSISIGFVWQQEIPIWVLSVVTLFLFEAQPNIGNKYSNIILLLVSYVAVISNFRRSNVAQQVLTFFEFKLMALTLIPILLTITTAIDYYNPNLYNGRSDQVQNPFAIASLVIFFATLALTLIILFFLWISRFLCEEKPKTVKGDDLVDWLSMVDLEWGHQKLEKKMNSILKKTKDSSIFTFHHPILRLDSR
jgi:hypothetical protein